MKRNNLFLAMAVLIAVSDYCLPNPVFPSGNLATALAYNINAQPLAAAVVVGPWVTEDIGNTALPGSATYNNGTFTVSASGVDLYNTSDGFRYVYHAADS